MTKAKFLQALSAIYACGNRADSDTKLADEAWVYVDMSGHLLCQHLDHALHAMLAAEVITVEEYQNFHDTLGDYI